MKVKSTPVLSLDQQDLTENGLETVTKAELEYVVNYLQSYFLDDGTFDHAIREAIANVLSQREYTRKQRAALKKQQVAHEPI